MSTCMEIDRGADALVSLNHLMDVVNARIYTHDVTKRVRHCVFNLDCTVHYVHLYTNYTLTGS